MVSKNTVEPGDLFRDNDRRNATPRIIRVVGFRQGYIGAYVEVVTVEHWNERRIGRTDLIRLDRLETRRLFTKVSH